ncbi:hypothetical protein F5146DRAFT_1209993 [Armillaria mellea]|nr:hypothetical protein F5146DRAFT_1209993 [Armillaria mellea]
MRPGVVTSSRDLTGQSEYASLPLLPSIAIYFFLISKTPVLSDPFVDNDLETSFDNIMVLAEASGRPILFVTTDYDMTGNDAWYNRICVQQSVTPYQVAQMMSLQFFSRVSMWFDRGVIDMILCVGEYGSFARAITDTFALYDLSFDPDFNTTCAVTKQEALCMFRMAYKDPKSNMIDENHDRFKELVEMAGEYRNSPDPQHMGELLLRQDFFYHFFGVALKHCDANFPLKHLRPPENIWKHSTMTREAVGTVAQLSSDQIRQSILDILLYPNADQGVECDVVRDGLEYSHVPILSLNASGLQSSLKPRDTALPKLLFALGILTMDLKDPRYLKIPNNIMMEEIRALLDLKAGDSVQEFSGAMWIKAHVEKYFRGLDVRYAKDTKEHTLQAIMIVLINQGADINGREVIEELHMMEKPRPPKNRTTHRYADLFLPRTHDVLELKNASIIDLYRGTYGLKLNPDDNDLREFRKQIGRMNISREILPTPTPESTSFYDKQDTGIRQPYKYKQLNDKCCDMGDQFIFHTYTRCVEPVVLRLAELCKRMRMYTTVPTYILKDYLLESSILFLYLLS